MFMEILKDHGIFLFKKIILLVVFIEFVVWKNLGECCCHRWGKLLDKYDKIESNFQIHFLYVGEGDSFVIKYYSQTKKKDFLFIVDAGEGISLIKKKTDVVQYIKSLMGEEEKNKEEKITINGVILTHPHHDHYWNMKDVFNNFNVEKFFYYRKIEDYQNIKFEDYISSLQYKKRIEPFYLNEPVGKKVFEGMGENRRVENLFYDDCLGIYAIGPYRSHDNFNDDSIVLFISYKGLRFLLMGDAGVAAENDLIVSWKNQLGVINIKDVDLIKIGHHGHHSSSCKKFVDFVKPKNVVNSTGPHLLACGLCNCHETPSVMRLWRDCRKEEEESVSILTTQEQGNIVAFVDETEGKASLKFCRN